MSKKRFICFLSLLIITMMLTSCGNTGSSTVKATQFGSSQKDLSLINDVKSKYGELGKGGTPRILEVLVTTQVVDFLPADRVQSYSKDTKELHVWFIYDNFNNGDTGTITWKYLDTNEVIATDDIVLTTSSDMKFGRYNGNIIGPDGGWPIGKYATVISVKGVDATAYFQVVEGNTVTKEFSPEGNAGTAGSTKTQTETSTTYSDANYPFKIDAVNDYKYTLKSGDVIFKSPTKEMYYVVEVIQSSSAGGTSSSKEDVASDYYKRFSDYNPTFPGEGKKTVDGKETLDTSVKYTADGDKYTNRFIIGDGGDYFYVLQFVVPDSELNADQALIEKIISSFKFVVKGTRNSNPNKGSSTTTPTTTTPTISALETAQKCYDDNYKKKIDDAYQNNVGAGTWDSYWDGIGADDVCNTNLHTCNEAIDRSHDYDDNYFASSIDSNINNWPMNKLGVEQMRVCYNKAVACNELAYKKICNLPNPTLKAIANVDESYCNQKYTEMLQGFRDQIPLIKAEKGDGQAIYKIESCYTPYKSCADSTNSVNTACRQAATDYTACTEQYYTSMANCAAAEFDCAEAYYKNICHTMATN